MSFLKKKGKIMKKYYRLTALCLSLLLVLLTLCGCGGKTTAESSSEVSFTVTEESSEITEDSSLETVDESSEITEEDSSEPSLAEEVEDSDYEEETGTESSDSSYAADDPEESEEAGLTVTEDGTYDTKDEVALYLHTYGHLPSNYIRKSEAEDLGWHSTYSDLADAAPGMSIGGDRFGNYEGVLPEGSYKECDIDYHGGKRNAKRIVYSSDGAIYYTEDHYETFEQLY